METVTQDYITNGLPQASVHDLHKGNHDCYGFILSKSHVVELCKTSHNQHEAVAAAAVVNSDVMTVLPDHVDHVSRPHVLMETEQQRRSSFTSQYVANHLQDLIASPSGMYIYINKNTLGVKKVRGQSEAALQIGMCDQKL